MTYAHLLLGVLHLERELWEHLRAQLLAHGHQKVWRKDAALQWRREERHAQQRQSSHQAAQRRRAYQRLSPTLALR